MKRTSTLAPLGAKLYPYLRLGTGGGHEVAKVEATTFRTMIEKSRERIVVADSSTLGVATGAVICPISEIHIIITDTRATDEAIAPLFANGIDVRRI